jgi:hypothetical protein
MLSSHTFSAKLKKWGEESIQKVKKYLVLRATFSAPLP